MTRAALSGRCRGRALRRRGPPGGLAGHEGAAGPSRGVRTRTRQGPLGAEGVRREVPSARSPTSCCVPCRAGPPPPAPAARGGQQEAAPEQRCYKLTLAYDGTGYHGFQLQRGPQRQDTVQRRLEAALTRFTGLPREALKVQAAGRTDAGVHARGQVAQFSTPGGDFRALDGATLQRALNSLLPPDIRVLCAARAPPDFNARFALWKTYHYDISTAPVADPFTARFRHCPSRPELLDLEAMEAAAAAFVGTHDFSAFSSLPHDGSARSPVKTLRAFSLEPLDGGVRWVVSGNGFLYKQVRHMVGALLAVGGGRLPAAAVAEALARGADFAPPQRRHGFRGWMVAEAKGLTLHGAVYPPHDDPSRPMYCPVSIPPY